MLRHAPLDVETANRHRLERSQSDVHVGLPRREFGVADRLGSGAGPLSQIDEHVPCSEEFDRAVRRERLAALREVLADERIGVSSERARRLPQVRRLRRALAGCCEPARRRGQREPSARERDESRDQFPTKRARSLTARLT
jgi:hypothetical protein